MTYKGYNIESICPPIPTTAYDYGFFKDGNDEDGFDGYGSSIDECKAQIDEINKY